MKDHQWRIDKNPEYETESGERKKLEWPYGGPSKDKKENFLKALALSLEEAEVIQDAGLPDIKVPKKIRADLPSPSTGVLDATEFKDTDRPTPREKEAYTTAAAYRRALERCAKHLGLLAFGDLTKEVPKVVEEIANFRKMARRQEKFLPSAQDAQKALIKCAMALCIPNNDDLAETVPKAVEALAQGAGFEHTKVGDVTTVKATKLHRAQAGRARPVPGLGIIISSDAYKAVENGSATYEDKAWLYKEINDWRDALLDDYRPPKPRADAALALGLEAAEARIEALEKMAYEHTNEITALRKALK